MCIRYLRVLLVACLCTTGLAQNSGSIRGMVLDENGQPLVGAEVSATKDEFQAHRVGRFFNTDSDGHFEVKDLPLGIYVVLARKEDEGYPETRLAFYSNLEVSRATLTAAQPDAYVTLRMSPKAGWLELSVVDQATGTKLQSATVTLRRVANPNLYISTSATNKRTAVPSQVDVSVEIAAPGYREWTESSRGGAPYIIRLSPGETSKLSVSLTR
jgi:hypothetical protein